MLQFITSLLDQLNAVYLLLTIHDVFSLNSERKKFSHPDISLKRFNIRHPVLGLVKDILLIFILKEIVLVMPNRDIS